MNGTVVRCFIFLCLTGGFLLLFESIRRQKLFHRLWRQTRSGLDEAARRRSLEGRRSLLNQERRKSLWVRLEQRLQYSGLKRLFPFLGAEVFVAILAVLSGAAAVFGIALWGVREGAALAVGTLALTAGLLQWGQHRALRAVDHNLMRFLDFLGNYSVTAGEVASVFLQVSRYVEEPLKGALEKCYYEAQTTGDTSMALLSLAEDIEHPKFKELIRSLEISARYSADFKAFVQTSRRSVREHLRSAEEQREMLREAFINMLVLAVMSLVIMLTLNQLISISLWQILLHTLPGHIALGIFGLVGFLFLWQIYRIYG